MSADPLEDVYEKYLGDDAPTADPEREIMARQSEKPCPKCESDDVDRSQGYRGEYRCKACGHSWQVGGKDSHI